MKDAIRQKARNLGFDDCRFTGAGAPAGAIQFQGWLAEKRHGEMSWLERTALKRIEPQNVLPGAKSIVCLAVSYATKDETRESRTEGHTLPSSRLSTLDSRPSTGFIARYARFADYHDVLGERLKTLTGFVNKETTRKARGFESAPYKGAKPSPHRGLGHARHPRFCRYRLNRNSSCLCSCCS